MRPTKLRPSTVAVASIAAAACLSVAAPVPANALTASAEPAVALASGQDSSLAQAIVIGSIETDDCTYTLVLDWDGFHIEVTCVSIS